MLFDASETAETAFKNKPSETAFDAAETAEMQEESSVSLGINYLRVYALLVFQSDKLLLRQSLRILG